MFGVLLMELRDGVTACPTSRATNTKTLSTPTQSAPQKPHALLIGNSHLKGIHADKLSRDFTTSIATAYSIKEAQQTIDVLQSVPSAITLQLTTNEAKGDQCTTDIAKEYQQLVQSIQQKLPTTKVLISHAPYKKGHTKLATRAALINASLDNAYHGTKITCTSNDHISSFSNDNIHLTKYGTSALVRNIRSSIEKLLNITPTPTAPHIFHRRNQQKRTPPHKQYNRGYYEQDYQQGYQQDYQQGYQQDYYY
jgi:lysophospholipase L1-like esterase